jgi:hypothetical protein
MMFGIGDAIGAIPEDRLSSMRIEELARKLMVSLAANPKALEWSATVVAFTAFELAKAYDDLAKERRK